MMLRRLLIVFCASVMAGCGADRSPVATTPATTAAQQGGLFSAFGTLASDDGSWIVTTKRRSKSLVDYTITDAATGTVHATGGGFSDAMRWFLYWDAQNRLWTHNSDMGPFGVWTFDGASAFTFHQVQAGDVLVGSIPQPVSSNLPSSVQRILGIDSQ